ncbi:MAG: hypothetical protein E4G96_07120 [Chrysiogenales bacterium]|nr:MAG: hypothetical protein E4G96_07120 [Chrysiogenales bacterium]
MNIEINKFFLNILGNSLETGQTNYLGATLDPNFNVYTESGFYENSPLPRKTAAEVLMRYFTKDEEIVDLFTIMLRNEGQRFYNATLNIWGRDEFFQILKRYKWIFDPALMKFSRDPFYEREINFLKKIRVIDFRYEVPIKNIIKGIEKASAKMSVKDLEWRITVRLYDLDTNSGELIRKILVLLLSRQNLQGFMNEIYVCLKELAINASKANYKILFEKHVTRPQGVTPDKDYVHFLRLFKKEIEEYGNSRLFELARQKDQYINITFQSTIDAIEVWVSNNQNISLIEKKQIMEKIKKTGVRYDENQDDDDEYTEGAGFGLNMILSILTSSSKDPEPLKVIFYPDSVKIGFTLLRSELNEKKLKISSEKET